MIVRWIADGVILIILMIAVIVITSMTSDEQDNNDDHLTRDAGPGEEKTHCLVAPNFLEQAGQVRVNLQSAPVTNVDPNNIAQHMLQHMIGPRGL